VLSALLLSIGLALDATAAAAARGMAAPRVRIRDAALLAALAGVFQGGMAALGWAAGHGMGDYFAAVDHWVAFTVLMVLGGRAVWAGVHEPDEPRDPEHAFALTPLLILAVATSIDAMAAGVTVPLLSPPPVVTLTLIGAVSLALSFAGVYVGRAIGAWLGTRLEIVGGLVLCGIGTKILIEHLS